jgi:hypothetical protein
MAFYQSERIKAVNPKNGNYVGEGGQRKNKNCDMDNIVWM